MNVSDPRRGSGAATKSPVGLWRAWLLSAAVLPLLLASAQAQSSKTDLEVWRHIPVLHHGRIMPLDTFARSAAEVICDRTNPTLEIDGKRQKFTAAELLLSWVTEPERWEEVPFLIAEHDDLRKDILGLPVTGPDGTHLKYVSPAEVAESQKLQETLEGIAEKHRLAQQKGETAQLTGVENKANELWDAFLLFRQITFDPRSADSPRSRFLRIGADVMERWAKVRDELQRFAELPGFADNIQQTDTALRSLAENAGRGRFPLEKVEPDVVKAVDGLQQLAESCTGLRDRIFDDKGKLPNLDAEQLKLVRSRINSMAAAMKLLARQSSELQTSLYDNGVALRVVPALNAFSLDKNRDTSDEAQPWLSLQAVLYGSPELLKDYPQPQISAVRATFGRLAAAVKARGVADSSQQLDQAESEFGEALRALGDQTTALRGKLKIEHPDEELIAFTAYPAVDATRTEVRYNQVDPFGSSWVISLVAFFCFCLAFGAARKPMFWLGVLVMGFGLAWAIYGFSLRVMVTRWAPVTNMYETVVYVPFFVSLLGGWFLMLPIMWPGLQRAWRLSAIPGTWEARGRGDDAEQAGTFGFLTIPVALGRLVLMGLVFQVLTMMPYAAGDRTIINLLPVVDEGSSVPNMNNLVVWIVGLCVLLPTVWYLPRVIVTGLMSLVTITQSLLRNGSELVAQTYPRKPFGLAATFAAAFGAFVAWYSPVLDKNFTPLQPILRDNFWLTIHVLTIVSSYGAGMLAWGLGNLSLGYYLFGRYRDPEAPKPLASVAPGLRPARPLDEEEEEVHLPTRRPPEECRTLAVYVYKTIQVAVLLLAAGTILGGLWADVSWGRFWGWDPKEVWALISLLTYLAILHGRFSGWFGDFALAAGSVLGATAIVFSWYGVNFYLGVGLHSYGFGAGGQWEVGMGVFLNWVFLGLAALRYYKETGSGGSLGHGDEVE